MHISLNVELDCESQEALGHFLREIAGYIDSGDSLRELYITKEFKHIGEDMDDNGEEYEYEWKYEEY